MINMLKINLPVISMSIQTIDPWLTPFDILLTWTLFLLVTTFEISLNIDQKLIKTAQLKTILTSSVASDFCLTVHFKGKETFKTQNERWKILYQTFHFYIFDLYWRNKCAVVDGKFITVAKITKLFRTKLF